MRRERTIAVHPDARRRQIGTVLVDEAQRRLPPTVETMDAWTRDDIAAGAWYERGGFQETFRYLHVYADEDELAREAVAPPGLTPVHGFFHASIEHEAELRARFRRVHVCRRFVKDVG